MTSPARTVFLGSGSFAVPILEALAEHPAVDLRAVVTAPSRPVGRGAKVRHSAIGARASAMAYPLIAPERLRAPEAIGAVERLAPELLVLADYGQIVPRALLDLPRHGALNLHPSLLPRHRGATPIPAAILAGDRRTGVSLMRMDEGLDTGSLIARREVPLRGDEVAPDLETALAGVAAELLADSLAAWLAGALPPVPQAKEGATLSRPLRREDGRLDPGRPARLLERQVRAYQPWPGSFLETEVGRLVVWRSQVHDEPASSGGRHGDGLLGSPGRFVFASDSLALTTAEGLLGLLEAQLAGGRRMGGAELIRGRPTLVGSRVLERAVG